MLRRVELPFEIKPSQVIGFEVLIMVALAASHLLVGVGLSGALRGGGGGLIGWALSEPIVEFLGSPLTVILALVMIGLGVALVANFGWGDAVRWLNHSSIKLQIWSDELDADVALRQSQIDARRREEARVRDAGQQPAPGMAQTDAEALIIVDNAGASSSSISPARNIQLPPINLLDEVTVHSLSTEDIDQKKRTIEQTLADFGLPATVTEIRKGPAVTQFGVLPGYIEKRASDGVLKQNKVRVGQIAALQNDLALALEVPRIRIEAPVPGRGIVGVEVPNSETTVVRLRAVIESEAFQRIASPLAVGLGRDVSGAPVATDLGALPHLLIAGTTGSGKSVCLNALITCLVFNNSPDRLKLVMIDPKKVEFIRFNGLPHLLGRVETEGERVIGVLRWLTVEMDRRYQVFEEVGARNLREYNRKFAKSTRNHQQAVEIPYICVFIDELADLITSYPGDVERALCRLAQMARATGIHLVVATQRPSTDVITGLIKANFPARASFVVASSIDSRVILDSTGADQLLGKGDMLFLSPDAGVPARLQGCFVSDREMENVVNYWRRTAGDSQPIPELEETKEEAPWDKMIVRSTFIGERDELLEEVIDLAKKRDTISTSYIQRRLRIGYPRAARIMETLHEMGLVDDPKEGGKTRRTLVNNDDDPLEELLRDQ
jgi:S-DNA-T family DNA segregation ATPase FtsK/SpoIIIE